MIMRQEQNRRGHKRVSTTIRLDEGVYAVLREIARLSNKSINYLIEGVLEDFVDRRELKPIGSGDDKEDVERV